MNYPKTLNICGKKYKVTFVADERFVDIDKENNLWGQINYAKREIRIFKGSNPEDILDTYIHEITHGILQSNPAIQELIKEDKEEAFVGNFATQLADTLMRNKLITL